MNLNLGALIKHLEERIAALPQEVMAGSKVPLQRGEQEAGTVPESLRPLVCLVEHGCDELTKLEERLDAIETEHAEGHAQAGQDFDCTALLEESDALVAKSDEASNDLTGLKNLLRLCLFAELKGSGTDMTKVRGVRNGFTLVTVDENLSGAEAPGGLMAALLGMRGRGGVSVVRV